MAYAATRPLPGQFDDLLERLFHLAERKADFWTETRAGLTTFMVMSYIVIVNPVILTTGAKIAGYDVNFAAVASSTCLVAALMTLAMAFGANLPFAIAPGMGVNAIVAFQLMAGMHFTFAEAMTVITLQGVLLTVFVVSGWRKLLLDAIPLQIKMAVGAGIGLFLLAIGAYEAGFYVVPLGATQGGTVAPATAGALGNFTAPSTLLAAFGLLLMGYLMARKQKGALLIGILVTTVVGIMVQAATHTSLSVVPGKLVMPTQVVSVPDFQYLGIGLTGWSFLSKGLLAGLLAVLSIGLSDLFDVAGTFTGLGKEAGLLTDSGNLSEKEKEAYLVDGLASAAGGLAGSSSGTTYIESASGIAEGGRTGLTAVWAAIPFLFAMWFGNVFAIVPQEATAGALILVGLLMLAAVGSQIEWGNIWTSLPAVLAMMLMPLTWSITNGIGAALIAYSVLNFRKTTGLVWVIAAVFAVYFAIGYK